GRLWCDSLPIGCPKHRTAGNLKASHESECVPYAFKAYAMHEAATVYGARTILWVDSCIVPIKPLGPLWEKIEAEGVWLSRNGWSNYEWTAESAYGDLFHAEIESAHEIMLRTGGALNLPELNKSIPHVVATAFGVSLDHPKGQAFLDEYYRLASQTRAF